MSENTKVYKSSIIPDKEFDYLTFDQTMLSPVWVVVILVISFIILKKFIYIKDEKKHGK
jgi:hypothetical protein